MNALCTTSSVAGAGGAWPRGEEVDDPDIEPQHTKDSCGPACALIAFRMLAAQPLPTQDDLYEHAGRCACDVATLARAMNACSPASEASGVGWTGQAITYPDDDFRALTLALAGSTPWIAHLRERASLGHFVVVERVTLQEVRILDPWHPGTRYPMLLDDFVKYWNLQLVWRRTQ
jgi:hypothetical protein